MDVYLRGRSNLAIFNFRNALPETLEVKKQTQNREDRFDIRTEAWNSTCKKTDIINRVGQFCIATTNNTHVIIMSYSRLSFMCKEHDQRPGIYLLPVLRES